MRGRKITRVAMVLAMMAVPTSMVPWTAASSIDSPISFVIVTFILLLFGIVQLGFGQNLNMVIEVNERLITTEITGAYLNFENVDGSKSRNLVGYYPGELILQTEDWKKITTLRYKLGKYKTHSYNDVFKFETFSKFVNEVKK